MGGRDEVGLEHRMALVDDFYARRGQPVRYQMSPAAHPADLDAVLQERGFAIEAPVHVQTAWIEAVLGAFRPASPHVVVDEQPSDPWLAAYTELFRRGDARTLRRVLLDRIAPPVGYALLRIDHISAAIGMGVAERGWLGIFSMGTHERFRRRGAATALLVALARWAETHHVVKAYLQVEEENDPAHRLYERAGFQTLYRYHYRIRQMS